MRALSVTLKLLAPVLVMVGTAHLAIGVEADVLLGARLPVEALTDPTLDSQNRFYGVSFTLYGLLMFLCASDLPKYQTVLRYVLWTFFAAGLARVVAMIIHGVPPPLVCVLLAIELLGPPAMIWWLSAELARLQPSAGDGYPRT
jgi:hypothetical protein